MNNRYLFRAKRIDNGEWVEGYYAVTRDRKGLQQHNILVSDNDLGYFKWNAVDRSTICQCTGLKDKNGKLIWENDILDGHIKRGAAFYRCIVLWNECNARFDVRAMECNFPMTLDECIDDISISGFDYEAIGNVFDNPDMVEEE